MDPLKIVAGYLRAKHMVLRAGYGSDIEWAESLRDIRPDPQYVLREAAWVILNSGFRYRIARLLWPRMLEVYLEFDPEKVTEECLPEALKILNHRKKHEAICSIASEIRAQGIQPILEDSREPLKLTRLPWIGPTTCWHLAKILGQDVIKPDVHLQRAAQATCYAHPIELAQVIKSSIGERLTVIDSVLWRYGEQRIVQGWPDWADLFGQVPVP